MKTKMTCTRCGGSGSYSFNLRDGTICYGCRGAGYVMKNVADLEKKAKSAAAREAASNAKREKYIAAMTAVKTKLNPVYGSFDLATSLGVHLLDCAVTKATGRGLVSYAEELLKTNDLCDG